MRTLNTQTTAVLAMSGRAEHIRVTATDAAGSWFDISTTPGFNPVDSLTISEAVDGQHRTLDLTLKREEDEWSVAGLRTDVSANLLSGSYSPLLELNRQIKVEIAITPQDTEPVSGDWLLVFHGRIDAIDDASGETVTVEARDLGGAVQDTFIETERAYGLAATGLRVFEPSGGATGGTYVLNELVVPTSGKLNGHYYRVSTAGTSASTEPVWPTGGGATVASGSAVFTEVGSTTSSQAAEAVMQAILNDNGLSAVTLVTPVSPSWQIKPYLQSRQAVFDAIREIANTIGWDVRYRWYPDLASFSLVFFEPDRTKTTPDITLDADDYVAVGSFKRDLEQVRNAVRVVYNDSAARDPAGFPKRKVLEVSDATSITKYGRRFMEIAEDSTSQIDTSTEATTLANNALADLKEPLVAMGADAYLLPHVEVGDLVRFAGNNVHMTADQDLACIEVRHSLQGDGSGGYTCRTALTCAGKPSIAQRRWLDKSAGDTRYGRAEIHRLQDVLSTTPLVLSKADIVGGQMLTLSADAAKDAVSLEAEWHLSDSASFTPSASTLYGITHGRAFSVPDLTPGQTYYAKAVPRGRNAGEIVRGEPTEEVSFVAARAQAGHLNPIIDFGAQPLNGSFETHLDPAAPPDHWTVSSGTLGTNVLVQTGSGAQSGDRYIKFTNVTAAREIRSAVFGVAGSSAYALAYSIRRTSGSLLPDVGIRWLDESMTFISTSSQAYGGGSSWARSFGRFTSPSGARFAQVFVSIAAIGAAEFEVDALSVRPSIPHVQESWVSAVFANSWVDFGSGYQAAQYMLDSLGFVHTRGLIKSGTIGLKAFTLPTGYRPAAGVYTIAISNNAAGTLEINTSGDVIPLAGSNVHFSLEGVTFQAV